MVFSSRILISVNQGGTARITDMADMDGWPPQKINPLLESAMLQNGGCFRLMV